MFKGREEISEAGNLGQDAEIFKGPCRENIFETGRRLRPNRWDIQTPGAAKRPKYSNDVRIFLRFWAAKLLRYSNVERIFLLPGAAKQSRYSREPCLVVQRLTVRICSSKSIFFAVHTKWRCTVDIPAEKLVILDNSSFFWDLHLSTDCPVLFCFNCLFERKCFRGQELPKGQDTQRNLRVGRPDIEHRHPQCLPGAKWRNTVWVAYISQWW